MSSPFNLDTVDAYRRWRDLKLEQASTNANELIVHVKNPLALSKNERAELLARTQKNNMAIYASELAMDESALQSFALQLGLRHLDANWLAGEKGVTRITVSHEEGQRQAYIPYTDKPIKWHTDGYYNSPERQIHGMVLHCVQNAGQGGENRLIDHEIVYLMLRDINPEFIRTLSATDAMTIPARTDEQGEARPAQTGPVFSVNLDNGKLHMRYTARTRSIEWKQDPLTLAAVAQLEQLLNSKIPYVFRLLLENGMGVICNNVLHDRTAFTDDPAEPRLLFRARYLDRLVEN
ncbi:MAG: TauD/TfdA family dioxygenase [Gallionellaceae bacterium]|nr:TauD/TfdA family dioxygenase [Gallionellaceae bacterium]